MKKLMVVAVLLVGVIGGGVFAWQHQKTTSMRAPVLASLKDADSAQFRNEHFSSEYLCGEINAKNSMGGYVGFKRYISYVQGYAMEGYPTDSFYPESERMQALIKSLDFQNEELTKIIENTKFSRKNGLPYERPSDYVIQEHANARAFEELWGKHC